MRPVSVSVAAGLGVVALVAGMVGALPAAADGPTTFSNTTAVAIPATGSLNQIGPANPYPSALAVSGMTGLVSNVTASLNGLTHPTANDLDVLLVAPTGANLVLLSDPGDPTTLTTVSGATLTFDDAAANSIPNSGAIATGTYKPTNNFTGDLFASPAPSPSTQTTMSGAFTGINPNGVWQMYIVDDATGDVGSLAGGWSLSITTEATALATTTTVSSSGTPAATGTAVTFTATVTAAGSPVTSGSVQFSDGVTPLGAPVALDAAGTASLTTSALAEGSHQIRAVYGGPPDSSRATARCRSASTMRRS